MILKCYCYSVTLNQFSHSCPLLFQAEQTQVKAVLLRFPLLRGVQDCCDWTDWGWHHSNSSVNSLGLENLLLDAHFHCNSWTLTPSHRVGAAKHSDPPFPALLYTICCTGKKTDWTVTLNSTQAEGCAFPARSALLWFTLACDNPWLENLRHAWTCTSWDNIPLSQGACRQWSKPHNNKNPCIYTVQSFVCRSGWSSYCDRWLEGIDLRRMYLMPAG